MLACGAHPGKSRFGVVLDSRAAVGIESTVRVSFEMAFLTGHKRSARLSRLAISKMGR